MNFTKSTLPFIFILFSILAAEAQQIEPLARTNISIGFNYGNLDFNGTDVFYSGGGGVGLEFGGQYEIISQLYAYATIGYQLNVSLQFESDNGDSNKTSFGFNRKFFTFGFNKFIPLSQDRTIQNIIFGFGINYSFPGDLNRIENDIRLGTINYNPNLGFHIDVKVALDIWEKFNFEPGIRFRSLELFADNFTRGNINSLPSQLRRLNTSGIELGLTISKKAYQP